MRLGGIDGESNQLTLIKVMRDGWFNQLVSCHANGRRNNDTLRRPGPCNLRTGSTGSRLTVVVFSAYLITVCSQRLLYCSAVLLVKAVIEAGLNYLFFSSFMAGSTKNPDSQRDPSPTRPSVTTVAPPVAAAPWNHPRDRVDWSLRGGDWLITPPSQALIGPMAGNRRGVWSPGVRWSGLFHGMACTEDKGTESTGLSRHYVATVLSQALQQACGCGQGKKKIFSLTAADASQRGVCIHRETG